MTEEELKLEEQRLFQYYGIKGYASAILHVNLCCEDTL